MVDIAIERSASFATMKSFYLEFGARVREARGTMSQEELAHRVGLSRASIANVERGVQRVPIHMITLFSEALGVKPDDLLPDPVDQVADLSLAARALSEPGQEALRMVLRKAQSTVAK